MLHQSRFLEAPFVRMLRMRSASLKTNSNIQGTNVRNVKKFSERYSIIPVAAFAKSNLDFDLIGPSIKLELLSLITKSRL